MSRSYDENIAYIKAALEKERSYRHAEEILEFDKLTMCPPAGLDRQEEAKQRVAAHRFSIRKDPEFVRRVEELYETLEEADPLDAILIKGLYRDCTHEKEISEELHSRIGSISGRMWTEYENARRTKNSDRYLETLREWIEVQKEQYSQWSRMPGEEDLTLYERMIWSYDRGARIQRLDELLGETVERSRALLERIEKEGKKIRTDFLYRETTPEQQRKLSNYLMELVGFDFNRGRLAEASYPFASLISEDDVRIVTKYYENRFLPGLYSVLHECGYALFEHMQPREDFAHFITDEKTQSMRESISRFYANIVGRSREFIRLIYPKLCEIYPKVMRDVTEEELYEAVNYVKPTILRGEADELTYTLHVVIRYELEKDLIDGGMEVSDLREKWNEKYRQYLGITPGDDLEGILQDIHWNLGFGYYPAYVLGNLCGGMILRRMREDFDPMKAIAAGDFAKINEWLRVHVCAEGNRKNLGEWIRHITGRRLCADDFMQYLEEKLGDIYGLNEESPVDRRLSDYVRRTYRIRLLSSPLLDDLRTAGDYSRLLNENFKEIGQLSMSNKTMISDLIEPLLASGEALKEESVERILSFNKKLMDNENDHRLDIPVVTLLSNRLMEDARTKEDVSYYIDLLDKELQNEVGLIEQTCAIIACREIADKFLERGLAAYREIMERLEDRDGFLRLDMRSRQTLMADSGFGAVLYRYTGMNQAIEEKMWVRIGMLRHSLELAEDPFYRSALPDYDWERHIVTCYIYLLTTNVGETGSALARELVTYCDRLDEFGRAKPERLYALFPPGFLDVLTRYIRYKAGVISREDYLEHLYRLWREADREEFGKEGGDNVVTASAYIETAMDGRLTEEIKKNIRDMYRSVTLYAFRIPKLDWISSILGMYSDFFLGFQEIPGGMVFEEFGLKMLAAFHPPTYIHSNMVAKLSLCLAEYLIDRAPERFVGIRDCNTVEEVNRGRKTVLDYVYHAALCHDFGKLLIIDTVFIYGRKLLDMEMPIIRSHALMGAGILERNESTKEYADVAKGHHMWYDGSGGYPQSFDKEKSLYHTVIDIVACADCMDAATDLVGRSYNRGKSLEEYIAEVTESSCTRYAPYLAELLQEPEVKKDLEFLLDQGRKSVYEETYTLLRVLQTEDVRA